MTHLRNPKVTYLFTVPDLLVVGLHFSLSDFSPFVKFRRKVSGRRGGLMTPDLPSLIVINQRKRNRSSTEQLVTLCKPVLLPSLTHVPSLPIPLPVLFCVTSSSLDPSPSQENSLRIKGAPSRYYRLNDSRENLVRKVYEETSLLLRLVWEGFGLQLLHPPP